MGPSPCKSKAKGQVTAGRMQPLRSMFSHGSPVLTLSLLENSKVVFVHLESSFGCSLGLPEATAWAYRRVRDGRYQRYLQVKPERFLSGGTGAGSGSPTQPHSSSEEPAARGCNLRSHYQHPPQTHRIPQRASDLPRMRGFFPHFQKSRCYGNTNGLHF